jgi:glycosyltransferase involved in cell wall biosynthesis
LATSEWTAAGLEQLGELRQPTVLYPPVLDPGTGRQWTERDDTFLIVGRFTPAKRIELAMSIVRRVRQQSIPHARLIIVGSPVDADYASRLRHAAASEGGWIEFREDLSRDQLYELMRQSRYGIHAMDREHFGMATAEMTRAGCLAFAHGSGGSTEVLNHEARLLWSTEDEAVQKIDAMAGQPAADVDALRSRLRAHAEKFSTESFVRRFRDIVEAQVSSRKPGSASNS